MGVKEMMKPGRHGQGVRNDGSMDRWRFTENTLLSSGNDAKVMDRSLSLLLDGRHLGVGWLVVSTFYVSSRWPF